MVWERRWVSSVEYLLLRMFPLLVPTWSMSAFEGRGLGPLATSPNPSSRSKAGERCQVSKICRTDRSTPIPSKDGRVLDLSLERHMAADSLRLLGSEYPG